MTERRPSISSALLAAAALLSSCGRSPRAAPPSPERTAEYLATFDPAEIERRGLDSTGERFDPAARLGIPLDEIDRKRDYDFDRLEDIEARLAGVDRGVVLAHLFRELTRDAADDRARHLAVLRFLHRASFHGAYLNPRRRDDTSVSDPLVLLEVNEMRCGNVSRLAVDLFTAGGYEARTVHFDGHTAAEVRYGGRWHYIDADGVGGEGLSARLPDGTIPSWRELRDRPELLDALPYKLDLTHHGRPRTRSTDARSVKCFFGDTSREQSYVTKSGALDDGDYGWDDIDREPVDWELGRRPARTQPGAVAWRAVEVTADPPRARLAWHPAEDRDDDLLGYRVFVSRAGRGWNFSGFAGDDAARAYWNDVGGWTPEMAPALYRLPPSDVARIELDRDTREVELELPADGALFVTVMAFDEYHEAAGKELYLSSNELRLDARR